MDKPKATPKDFFLWAGAMLAFYSSVVAFITLIFEYLNHVYPDTQLNYYYDPYASGVAYAMASLIVLAPTFLILMRSIRRSIERDPSRSEVWVRRWALFLTVFVAGVTIVIDLIVLLNTFLSGEELTLRFMLKVLVVLLVAGASFMHFLADIWGYWVSNPSYARYINWSAGALVVLTIAAGFLIIGTPQSQRALRLDSQRVTDLQTIQWQIVTYWQQKKILPTTLADLQDPLSGVEIPTDPVTNQPYKYTPQGALNFALCATFTTEGKGNGYDVPVRVYGSLEGSWTHSKGEVCFNRTIDPDRYPPYTDKPTAIPAE